MKRLINYFLGGQDPALLYIQVEAMALQNVLAEYETTRETGLGNGEG